MKLISGVLSSDAKSVEVRWEERQHRDSSTSTLQGFGGPVLKQLLQHNVAGAITKHSRCAAALQ